LNWCFISINNYDKNVCAAAYIALRSIVMVELLGIQKLTNAFGLCSLFQGIACVIGSPLSGIGAIYCTAGGCVSVVVICVF